MRDQNFQRDRLVRELIALAEVCVIDQNRETTRANAESTTLDLRELVLAAIQGLDKIAEELLDLTTLFSRLASMRKGKARAELTHALNLLEDGKLVEGINAVGVINACGAELLFIRSLGEALDQYNEARRRTNPVQETVTTGDK
jgi:hypothetical protein